MTPTGVRWPAFVPDPSRPPWVRAAPTAHCEAPLGEAQAWLLPRWRLFAGARGGSLGGQSGCVAPGGGGRAKGPIWCGAASLLLPVLVTVVNAQQGGRASTSTSNLTGLEGHLLWDFPHRPGGVLPRPWWHHSSPAGPRDGGSVLGSLFPVVLCSPLGPVEPRAAELGSTDWEPAAHLPLGHGV